LLNAFTNPAPAKSDFFGFPVVALGSDRVFIGAWAADAGATNAGVAYLFSTNGTLLTTFTNPAPASDYFFGFSIAVLGADRILIGALRDRSGVGEQGVVYMYDTNGVLLSSFTNPNAANNSDNFGTSMAVIDESHVIIGAYLDDKHAQDEGAAYLLFIATAVRPLLSLRLTATNTVVLSWPSPSTGFTLQQNIGGLEAANWADVAESPSDDGITRTVMIGAAGGSTFCRLVKH
jgi:hypothetical protein